MIHNSGPALSTGPCLSQPVYRDTRKNRVTHHRVGNSAPIYTHTCSGFIVGNHMHIYKRIRLRDDVSTDLYWRRHYEPGRFLTRYKITYCICGRAVGRRNFVFICLFMIIAFFPLFTPVRTRFRNVVNFSSLDYNTIIITRPVWAIYAHSYFSPVSIVRV